LQQLSDKKGVELEACGVKLPKMTIPAGCVAVFPVNIEGIRYATAQLVAKREGRIYMMQIPGIPTTIALQSGKTLKNVKAKGVDRPVLDNIYLLSKEEAEHLFLNEKKEEESKICEVMKVKEAGPLRKIEKGPAKVAEAPSEQDWADAAVYRIDLSSVSLSALRQLLTISYQGDCARLYADGKLIADHFQYGRPFLYGLWRLPEGVHELELRILPMQKDAPVYLPREADKMPGESVKACMIVTLNE